MSITYNKNIITAAGNVNHKLVTFDWHLIDVCNYKCSYCGVGYGADHSRPKSKFFNDATQLAAYKNVITRLKLNSNPEFEVAVLGGEPTLHPKLPGIVQALSSIEKCKTVTIVTNMSKPVEYFTELITKEVADCVILSPSIHFQYYKHQLNKCIELKRHNHINIRPIVMLSDNRTHWDYMEMFINGCIDSDISCEYCFIENTEDYSPVYSDTFFDRFKHILSKDDDSYIFYTSTGEKLLLTRREIQSYNVKKFKGWECTPVLWYIDHTGVFRNGCTGELLDITCSNIAKKVVCPLSCCDCDAKWQYYKEKPQ